MGLFPAKDMQTHPLPLLSFDLVFMDDAECTEYNKKRNKFSSNFFFSSYCEKCIENCSDKDKNDHNVKNKMRKNEKFDFSFALADSSSFM